jgi:hypothetical protein
MASEINVASNLPDLKRHLSGIGRDMSAKVVRAATAAAARVFRRIAAQLVPVLKPENKRKGRVAGALKANIYIRRSKDAANGKEHYFVGFRQGRGRGKIRGALRSDTFYGKFLEGGWMPRGKGNKITGGRRRATQQRVASRSAGAAVVQYPFLLPAFQRGRNEALSKFFAIADTRIAKLNDEKTSR